MPLRTDLTFEKLSNASFQHVLAISQAGAGDGAFLHVSPNGTLDVPVLNAASGTAGSIVAASTTAVPPSPLTSWLQQWGEAVDGAVLTTYDSRFSSSFYRSSFDDAAAANAVRCG